MGDYQARKQRKEKIIKCDAPEDPPIYIYIYVGSSCILINVVVFRILLAEC